MLLLDIPTLGVAISVVGMVAGLGLLVAGRGRALPGVAHWAAAFLLNGLAYLLFALRGLVPDFASIVVGNVVLLLAVQLTLVGVNRFQDRPRSGRLRVAARVVALLGVAFGLWYLSAVVPHLHARIVLVSVPGVAMGAEVSWKLLRGPTRGAALSTRTTGVATLLFTLFFLLRGVAALGVEPTAAPHPEEPIHRLSAVVYLALIVAHSFGMAWMTGERLMSRLEYVARTDGLTRLENRRAILAHLAVAVERARRSGRPLSVVMLDLDHFKRVNDVHGHAAGDHALEWLSDVIRAQVRAGDRIGRLGGEEFLVVLGDAGLAVAGEVAERIRQGVARRPLELGAGDADAEALLGRADAALYRAKRAGRDRVALDAGLAQPG